jgi:nucleotide sugar dehydrogenase
MEREELTGVGIVGQGFVGGSMATVLAERGVIPFVFDIAGKVAPGAVSTSSFNLAEHTRFCDGIGIDVHFVCLPTPMMSDGKADTSIVLGAIEEIACVSPPKNSERIVVVKSTVPPGSCASWDEATAPRGTRVVFSPEFLTEANCLDDMRNQDRIVLGGNQAATSRVAEVFGTAFSGVPIIQTTSSNAEMVKYVANCFLATKVSFANEMKQICDCLSTSGVKCDFNTVVEVAKLDTRLGDTHWSVPGPDGKKGFGGSCFPKDINSLIFIAKSVGLDASVIRAAWEKNLQVRPERDWERLKGRAVV